MRPVLSARGMKSAGETSPRVRLFHLSSASTETTSPLLAATWGWNTSVSSPLSSAIPRSASKARSAPVSVWVLACQTASVAPLATASLALKEARRKSSGMASPSQGATDSPA